MSEKCTYDVLIYCRVCGGSYGGGEECYGCKKRELELLRNEDEAIELVKLKILVSIKELDDEKTI